MEGTAVVASYDELAHILGVTHCRGITPSGHYCAAEHGYEGTVGGRVLHFSDRPFTKKNALDFLRLAVVAIDPSINDDIPWRRVYRRHVALRRLASRFGVLYRPSATDKAFVLAGTAGLPNEVWMRKQAFDWARRGKGTP